MKGCGFERPFTDAAMGFLRYWCQEATVAGSITVCLREGICFHTVEYRAVGFREHSGGSSGGYMEGPCVLCREDIVEEGNCGGMFVFLICFGSTAIRCIYVGDVASKMCEGFV